MVQRYLNGQRVMPGHHSLLHSRWLVGADVPDVAVIETSHSPVYGTSGRFYRVAAGEDRCSELRGGVS
jgi:hypothetical protein